jgi:hypothetical protein
VALSLEQLNERLWAWINHYHRTQHGALVTTPLLRWQRDIEHVRKLPPATDLRRLFFHRLDRLVRRNSTFLLHSGFYEAPAHLAGQRIEVRFDPLDLSHVEIYFQGQAQGWVRPVDPVVNAQLSCNATKPPHPQRRNRRALTSSNCCGRKKRKTIRKSRRIEGFMWETVGNLLRF